MKILVVDNDQKHQESARQTLAEHELVIVENFDQAQEILSPKINWKEYERLVIEENLSDREAKKRAMPKPDFDVVLSDLLMAKGSDSGMGERGRILIRQEMGYGYPIVFLAANAGVPLIGVFTDKNHHDHPMSYTFDFVGGYRNDDFTVNSSRVMFRHCENFTASRGKDWSWLLYNLTKEE